MITPKDLKYTKSHEWVRMLDNGNAQIGITEHAQEAMGDLVFVDLPQMDDVFELGDGIAVVESVKAVSDVYAPIGGRVVAVNEQLLDEPGLINEACYDAWLVELTDVVMADLLTVEEYEAVLQEEA